MPRLAVIVGRFGRELVTVILLTWGFAGRLGAQVGLRSAQAQVNLVARAAPAGSITAVGIDRDTGILLRVSANTGYRLVAKSIGAESPGGRIWVRSVAGELEELTPDASITVARGNAASDRELELRLQSGDLASQPLPVRYDLYIDPAL